MDKQSVDNKKGSLREGVSLKFIDKWASIYVERLLKGGKEEAYNWGMRFFNKDDVEFIAARAREILRGRGLGA